MDTCSECGKALSFRAFITTGGGGSAHAVCYHRANPPKVRETFAQVLGNCDDQVLVRQLLIRYVPAEYKNTIIRDFNNEMARRHKSRIAEEDNRDEHNNPHSN